MEKSLLSCVPEHSTYNVFGFIPSFHAATMGLMRLASHPSHLLYLMFNSGYFQSETPASGSKQVTKEFQVLCSSEILAF